MATAGRARDAARWVVSGSRVLIGGGSALARMARRGGLRDTIKPWMRFNHVQDVPFELIAGQGVKGVLFDLENTLIPPGGPFDDESRAVLERVRGVGLRMGVITNCSASWARRALEDERIAYIAPAHKPSKDAFTAGCKAIGLRPHQCVFIGDQVITDVFGAQRAGLRAILLEPRWETEALSSRFQRLVSRALLKAVR